MELNDLLNMVLEAYEEVQNGRDITLPTVQANNVVSTKVAASLIDFGASGENEADKGNLPVTEKASSPALRGSLKAGHLGALLIYFKKPPTYWMTLLDSILQIVPSRGALGVESH